MATRVDTTTISASPPGEERTAACIPPGHSAVILPFRHRAPLSPAVIDCAICDIERLAPADLIGFGHLFALQGDSAAPPALRWDRALRAFLCLARALDDAGICVAEVLP